MFELDLITMNLSPTTTIWPYFGDFSLHHNTPKRPHLVHLKILRYFSKTQRIFLFSSTGFFHFQQNWHITNGIFNLWQKAFIDSHDIAYANSVLCHPLLKVLYELCLFFWLPSCCYQHENHGPKRSITTLSHVYGVKLLHYWTEHRLTFVWICMYPVTSNGQYKL